MSVNIGQYILLHIAILKKIEQLVLKRLNFLIAFKNSIRCTSVIFFSYVLVMIYHILMIYNIELTKWKAALAQYLHRSNNFIGSRQLSRIYGN